MTYIHESWRTGVRKTPKHHEFVHLLVNTDFAGNPTTYDNFYDESLNRVLSSLAKTAFATVWEARIFAGWHALQEIEQRQRT